jgi:hypothetical protein
MLQAHITLANKHFGQGCPVAAKCKARLTTLFKNFLILFTGRVEKQSAGGAPPVEVRTRTAIDFYMSTSIDHMLMSEILKPIAL